MRYRRIHSRSWRDRNHARGAEEVSSLRSLAHKEWSGIRNARDYDVPQGKSGLVHDPERPHRRLDRGEDGTTIRRNPLTIGNHTLLTAWGHVGVGLLVFVVWPFSL